MSVYLSVRNKHFYLFHLTLYDFSMFRFVHSLRIAMGDRSIHILVSFYVFKLFVLLYICHTTHTRTHTHFIFEFAVETASHRSRSVHTLFHFSGIAYRNEKLSEQRKVNLNRKTLFLCSVPLPFRSTGN